MPLFKTRGASLCYQIYGEGIPLFFLHGMGGDKSQAVSAFEPQVGIQLIVLDQEAHGESTVNWDGFGFAALAEDVVALADYLKIDAFIVGGISMGAAVSLKIAIDYPERVLKLFLIRNAWINQPMKKQFVQLYKLCGEYLAKNDALGFKSTDEFKALELESPKNASSMLGYFSDDTSLKYWKKLAILPSDSPLKSWNELEAVTMPVLILSNHEDPVHVFDYGLEIARHLVRVTSEVITSKAISEAKHREELNYYLGAFLKEEES